MTKRQWTLTAGLGMAVVFATALTIRVLPEIRLVAIGSDAPDFHAVDLRTAHPVTMADYRGKVILLNIWATWCQPCRVEMPALQRLSRTLAGTDFHVVAVSIDDADSTVVDAFARQLGLTFDILHNRAGDIQRIYQTTGVPESFVINRQASCIRSCLILLRSKAI